MTRDTLPRRYPRDQPLTREELTEQLEVAARHSEGTYIACRNAWKRIRRSRRLRRAGALVETVALAAIVAATILLVLGQPVPSGAAPVAFLFWLAGIAGRLRGRWMLERSRPVYDAALRTHIEAIAIFRQIVTELAEAEERAARAKEKL